MHRSYESLIKPIIESIKPRHIVEIGAKEGENTVKLLEYCKKNRAKLSVVDPVPAFSPEELMDKYIEFDFYEEMSLDALKRIKGGEVFLIDGDHNYYTVMNELKIIEIMYGDSFPFIFFHDVAWPYARRDMYYAPDSIPKDSIHEFRNMGILYGENHLVEGGFNAHMKNALLSNTPQNGVLTAIEDFVSESELDLELLKVEYMNGIGLLIPSGEAEVRRRFEKCTNNVELVEVLEQKFSRVNSVYEYKMGKNKRAEKAYLAELENQKAEADKLKEDIIQLEMKSEGVSKAIEKYEGDNRKLTTELSCVNVALKHNKELLKQQKKIIKNYSKELQTLQVTVSNQNKVIDEHGTKMKEKESALKEKDKKVIEYSEQLEVQKSKVKAIKKELRQVKKEVSLLNIEVTKNYTESKLLLDKHKDEMTELTEKSQRILLEKEEKIKEFKRNVDVIKKDSERSALNYKVEIDAWNEKQEMLVKDRDELKTLVINQNEFIKLTNIKIEKATNIALKQEVEILKQNDFLASVEYENEVSQKVHDRVNTLLCKGESQEASYLLYEYTRYQNGFRNSEIFCDNKDGIRVGKNNRLKYISVIISGGLKKFLKLRGNINLLESSDLFDDNYYLLSNPDVYYSKMNPYVHYLYYGAYEGRNPSSKFDAKYYQEHNTDIGEENVNPLLHYINHGKYEDRVKRHVVEQPQKSKLGVHKKIEASNIEKVLNGYKPKINGPMLSSEEVVEASGNSLTIYENIMALNRGFINTELPDELPLVSIVILNRDGLGHLKTMFKNFTKNTIYPNYEIVVVDNASTDGSVDYLNTLSERLPIVIIENNENVSYSKGNNQGVLAASGEYLVLMNNDIEPTFGWLNEMIKISMGNEGVGAVGAKLVYPDMPISALNAKNGYKLQHVGINFRSEAEFIRPYNMGNGCDIFDAKYNISGPRACVTAAVLLVKRSVFDEVSGLDEKYIYGYEDVDFCLKLLKKGYTNYYCSSALLYHHEFGTQNNDVSSDLRNRRLNNMKVFKSKWYKWLQKKIFESKLNDDQLFSESPMKVGIVVTEYGEESTAGDYFTGLELATAMEKMGWNIKYLPRRGPEDWYDVGVDTDVVVSLLQHYDPNKIVKGKESLITIAWLRNWFEKWVEMPGFDSYSLIYASSETAVKYVKEYTEKPVELLPIATNPSRFEKKKNIVDKFICDYCFTGSYWNDPREIIDLLAPKELSHKFNIYGANWDQLEKFKPYHKGFLRYDQMSSVYDGTKIVIDDANRVTKSFGAVNSRVFDAIANECLVLTNGTIGAQETFNGMLPSYSTKEELHGLINKYMLNDEERIKKISELREFVIENHTYDHRANRIKKSLFNYCTGKKKVAIKVPAPRWDVVHEWGDYHFALAMKKQFELHNWNVQIQILPEWDDDSDSDAEMVIVLRGLSVYKPKPHHINVMWNISHPDKVELKEYELYDHVFIASQLWAEKLQSNLGVSVEAMMQCTDPELFYKKIMQDKKDVYELLFVGNSRKIFRNILKDLLPTKRDLSVYGSLWKGIIDKKYIKGDHVKNSELGEAYNSCKVLLNDHWDDMKEKGFVSNRLFDGYAAGAFIISDKIEGAEELFNGALVTYETKEELEELIEYYLKNDKERIKLAKKGQKAVMKGHTFERRVDRFIEVFNRKNFKESVRYD